MDALLSYCFIGLIILTIFSIVISGREIYLEPNWLWLNSEDKLSSIVMVFIVVAWPLCLLLLVFTFFIVAIELVLRGYVKLIQLIFSPFSKKRRL